MRTKSKGVKKFAYERSFPDNFPINGIPVCDSRSPIIAAAKDSRTDSKRNCHLRLEGLTPSTFRTPTSFALSSERAVDRFIKFMQAMSMIKTAIQENRYTFSRL